jgi:O-antigen/teichoic acid export membrane protein
MNLFLKVTAFFEGLTGLGLILIPKTVIQFLFVSTLNEAGGIMAAMIAGAAILSIAFYCWSMSRSTKVHPLIKVLSFYNIVVVAIAVYGLINFPIKGIGILGVIGFHGLLTLWSFSILRRTDY